MLIGALAFFMVKPKIEQKTKNSVDENTLSNIIGEPSERIDNVTEFIEAP